MIVGEIFKDVNMRFACVYIKLQRYALSVELFKDVNTRFGYMCFYKNTTLQTFSWTLK